MRRGAGWIQEIIGLINLLITVGIQDGLDGALINSYEYMKVLLIILDRRLFCSLKK